MSREGFQGARVVIFESRMADAMAHSVRTHGGEAIMAPSVKEVPLMTNRDLLSFGERLIASDVDLVVFMTGVGARLLLEMLLTRYEPEEIVAALNRTTIVARGPKPASVLREYGVVVTMTVPDPSTWRELIQLLDVSSRGVGLQGKTIAIQEYGAPNDQLIKSLQTRGAHVIQLPVYRWALPDDRTPLLRAVDELLAGRVDVAMFTNAVQVHHLVRVASEQGLNQRLKEALRRLVIASIGPHTSQVLTEYGLRVDIEPSRPNMGSLVTESAHLAPELIRQKSSGAFQMEPAVHPSFPTAEARALLEQTPFLLACHRHPTAITPVWLMRQAGRYLPEYRRIRDRVPFLELCKSKELVAEVTIAAVEKIRADAAIIFSDILLIVEPLGLGLEYVAGDGPVITGQIATGDDVDRLTEIEPADSLQFVFDALRLTRESLSPRIPLIGFSGAPFTLASYMIEGGGSSSFVNTKRFMYGDPGAWYALLAKISRGLVKYLNGQIDAGADAVQLFDSWVGCLGPEAYREFVLPHTQSVIQGLRPKVPVLHFGTGTASLLPEMKRAGGQVIGIDFRVELEQAWNAIGEDVGIQGNLDPAVLCTSVETIRTHVRRILRQADERPGHIFNLGHGVLPETPVDHVLALVDAVHELSRRQAAE